MPSKRRRPVSRVRKSSPAKHGPLSDSRRPTSVLNATRAAQTNGQSGYDPPPLHRNPSNGATAVTETYPSPGVPRDVKSANGASGLSAAAPRPAVGGNFKVTEEAIRHMWQASEATLPDPRLRPSPSHSLRRITAHRSRSGLWTTLGLVSVAAALTVTLLMFIGGSAQSDAEARQAALSAAALAAGSVENSFATLELLRAGGSFTPELVLSVSALGEASRTLVESAAALPIDDDSLAEIRMSATVLAGRVSRLGETFGAAFSYRGQVGPHLTLPDLEGPLDLSNLSENTAALTDWQFRLEQAASTRPVQPRLLQNQQALQATLPYIAVHRQAYSDAVANSQSEQAQAALTQITSLVSAISHDFDRAYREITEITETEIESLAGDLQSLSTGT